MNITAPNIFKFATKELSQDAFFCWLLSFGKPEYSTSEFKELHLVALDLLYSFTDDNSLIVKGINITTQKSKIDIWIEVTTDNAKQLIIIEEKTNSNAGSNQLATYSKIANDFCIENGFSEFFCIYLKTGNEAKRVFERSASHENWKYFSLENLMNILDVRANKIDHPFFQDFYKINHSKKQLNENFEKHINKEDYERCKGEIIQAFYARLEKDDIFRYHNFADGPGYRKYYSNDYIYNEVKPNIYLQLDHLSLTLKVDLGEMRDETGKQYKKFQQQLRKKNIRLIFDGVRTVFQNHDQFKATLKRPTNFSVHNFLTVGKIDHKRWLRFDSDGNLNYHETKRNIENLKCKVDEVTEANRKTIIDIIANGLQQPII